MKTNVKTHSLYLGKNKFLNFFSSFRKKAIALDDSCGMPETLSLEHPPSLSLPHCTNINSQTECSELEVVFENSDTVAHMEESEIHG